MNTLVLQRGIRNQNGIFSDLAENDNYICDILERPWFNNAENISCIPAGTYLCTPETSAKFPYTHYRLHDVPNRTDVLIHRGNTIIDTHGCILVGLSTNAQGIEHSKDALNALVDKYPNGFTLVIKD